MFNWASEKLDLLISNPNNNDITKQFKKVESAEMFDEGQRMVVSMGNGDLLVYQLHQQEQRIEMMIGPYEGEARDGKEKHFLWGFLGL